MRHTGAQGMLYMADLPDTSFDKLSLDSKKAAPLIRIKAISCNHAVDDLRVLTKATIDGVMESNTGKYC